MTQLEVGYVSRAHGLRGEVVVKLTSDRLSRLAPGSVLQTKGGPLTVEASRPHQDRWIVQFEGVFGREAAEAMRGTVLSAEPIDDESDPSFAVEGTDAAMWVHEVIGAAVVTVDGQECGRVESVQANPASDLLVLTGGVLVPAVFVVDTSGLPARLVIDPPEGLLTLNEMP